MREEDLQIQCFSYNVARFTWYLLALVYYYSINYGFYSGSLEGKYWKYFHLFWRKIYSLTCLCIMFGTWAKRRMNVLGRENLRFSRWFSSVYVLFCITHTFCRIHFCGSPYQTLFCGNPCAAVQSAQH